MVLSWCCPLKTSWRSLNNDFRDVSWSNRVLRGFVPMLPLKTSWKALSSDFWDVSRSDRVLRGFVLLPHLENILKVSVLTFFLRKVPHLREAGFRASFFSNSSHVLRYALSSKFFYPFLNLIHLRLTVAVVFSPYVGTTSTLCDAPYHTHLGCPTFV